jgi:hypothetical protein
LALNSYRHIKGGGVVCGGNEVVVFYLDTSSEAFGWTESTHLDWGKKKITGKEQLLWNREKLLF